MEERGTRQDKPMKPQVVAWELGKRLGSDAVVACDRSKANTSIPSPVTVSSALSGRDPRSTSFDTTSEK